MLITVGLVVERSRFMIRERYRNELEDAYIHIHIYIYMYVNTFVYTYLY